MRKMAKLKMHKMF